MTLDEALTENALLKANLEAVQFQLEQLRRLIFGHKRETLDLASEQAALPFDTPAETDTPVPLPEIAVPAHSRARQVPKRETLPAHLPREIEILDLAEDKKPCPCCGGARHVIGEAVSEKLEYVPAQLKVLQTRRTKYACPSCAGEIGVAPLPPQAIEKGIAGPGLLAHVLVGKFVDHLPLNRQEAMLRRQGIELPRSTLCDWVLACGDLLAPLHARLSEIVRGHDILHGDDTPVPLQAKGGTLTARAWNYLAPAANLVAYDFTEDRGGRHPQAWLKDWRGYLVADAYSGYDRLYEIGRAHV
jgi:transposase